jgi:hypothetical protein
LEHGIEDGVGDVVGDFVGVSHRYGLAGEKIGACVVMLD